MTPNTYSSAHTEEKIASNRPGPIVVSAGGGPPEDPSPHASIRRTMLRRFEVWLDDILAMETPPAGIPAEILARLGPDPQRPEARDRSPDLATLWSAMLRMVEETRLQGRSFEQLHQDLKPIQSLVGSVTALQQQHEEVTDQHREQLRQSARDGVFNEMLDLLIDMRDRLKRGSESAEEARKQIPHPKPWSLIGRWTTRSMTQSDGIVAALIKGYDLCREQLDEVLSRYGVQPIECLGQPFDPVKMKAVDTDQSAEAEEGTVLDVYRPGYRQHDRVYRPAEVKVARRATEDNPA